MLLSDAIQAFLSDREAKGAARATIWNERQALTLLLSDIGNIKVKSMRPQHIDLYWTRRTTWGPGTLNRVRTHLNTFFKWCQNRGYMRRDVDLLAGQKNRRVPMRPRIIIPQDQFETFLDGIETPRSRAAVATGLYLFTRIGETQGIRWQDVNFDSKEVQVYREKTNQLDSLPLCNELEQELRRWRLAYAAYVGEEVQPGWFLIPGYVPPRAKAVKGVKGFGVAQERATYLPMKKPHLAYTIRAELTAAGYYQAHEGGHTLRRSGATALYNSLADRGHDRAIRMCQAMLGHASINTTETYLRLELDRKVRNDLLAGKRMFPERVAGSVIDLGRRGVVVDGQENDRGVRM